MDRARRDFLSKSAMIAAAGAISVNEIKHKAGDIMNVPSGNGGMGSANPTPEYYDGPRSNTLESSVPNMPREAAFKLLGENFLVRREIREQLAKDAKYAITPSNIDPDIAILKSLSPMAKLTFARQRYIERGTEALFKDETFSGIHGRTRDILHQKLHDLMWSPKNLLSDYLKS